MKKRILELLLVMSMLVIFAPWVQAATIVDSGELNENVTYLLDADGTLTISGKGSMGYYGLHDKPWAEHIDEVKKVIISDGITDMGSGIFADCTKLQQVTIPDSITEIAPLSFEGCTSLRKIDIPSQIITIAYSAFYGCYNLQEVALPENLKTIGDWAFSRCLLLKNIKIPNSVSSIGSNAFYSYTAIIADKGSYALQYAAENNIRYYGYWSVKNGTLTIGGNNGMDKIFDTYTNSASGSRGHAPWKDYAEKVTKVIIDDGITDVGGYAFYKFNNLKTVSIPNTVTQVQMHAFRDCGELENVIIPSSCTALDSTAFDHCSALKSISIPANVTSIDHELSMLGRTIFAGCLSMETINVDSSNTSFCSVDGVLFTKDMKTLLKYPDGKKGEIYEIPHGVTNIGNQAFLYSNYLSRLIIPKTMEKIDYYALSTLFTDTNLTDIYYKGSKAEWESMPEIYDLPNTSIHYNAIGTNPPKITGTPTISNNKLNINLTDVEYDSSLITVFSDDNKMISSAVTPISASDTTKSVVLPNNGENQAKVFIWDSLEGMRPLCEAKTVAVK